eukprot:14959824-Alexandrium_andersonii.AAC.1
MPVTRGTVAACWFYVGYAGNGGWSLIGRVFKEFLPPPVLLKSTAANAAPRVAWCCSVAQAGSRRKS